MVKNNGISLIVLVITIIVIIVLVGAVILTIANNNPIAGSNEAVFKANLETYNSELSMAISKIYTINLSFNPALLNAGTWDGNVANINGTVRQYITTMKAQDGLKFEIQKGKLVYMGDIENEKIWVTDVGLMNKVALGVNVIATVNSTVDGSFASYKNPIIPKGFKAINDGSAWPVDWNNGLVIEDAGGNQFVWVPVDTVNVPFSKDFAYPADYAVTSANTVNDTLPDGILEITQITNYGGFYIARFEAGKEAANVVTSKRNVAIWGNINYNNAKAAAESLYNTESVRSGLVTGTQWDTILNWIGDVGINLRDSRTWGNFTDALAPANVSGYGALRTTGYSEFWKAKNIYDLAGNAFEWTNEIYGSYVIARGGNWYNSGASIPVCYRGIGNPVTTVFPNGTFRTVLYVL